MKFSKSELSHIVSEATKKHRSEGFDRVTVSVWMSGDRQIVSVHKAIKDGLLRPGRSYGVFCDNPEGESRFVELKIPSEPKWEVQTKGGFTL